MLAATWKHGVSVEREGSRYHGRKTIGYGVEEKVLA